MVTGAASVDGIIGASVGVFTDVITITNTTSTTTDAGHLASSFIEVKARAVSFLSKSKGNHESGLF